VECALSPTLCPDYTVDRFVELARGAGFDRVELFRDRTESTPVHHDFSVSMVRDFLQRQGVTLASFQIRDLTGRKADSDERNLGYNLRQLEWDIHLGRALRAERMVVCAGEKTDDTVEADLTDGLGQLAERVPQVSLNLGSRAASRVQGLADYEQVLAGVTDSSIGVCLDTGELLGAGEDVVRVAASLATRLGIVRLQDRSGDGVVQPGRGDLPLEDLLSQLQRGGYRGDLVVSLAVAPEGDRHQLAEEARRRLTEVLAGLPVEEAGA
jgi:sugar phosphate isomerase/epimerase